jgi:hypothetical protein
MFEWGKLRDTACVAAGHTSTVVVLLDAGSSVDKTDEAGWTALSIAAARGHDSTMAALLGTAGGANVDARNRNMTTALIACAALDTCRSDILVFLLEAVRTYSRENTASLTFENDHFAKTGSGQTSARPKDRNGPIFLLPLGGECRCARQGWNDCAAPCVSARPCRDCSGVAVCWCELRHRERPGAENNSTYYRGTMRFQSLIGKSRSKR